MEADAPTLSDLIEQSLEAVGETDIVPLYFARFFAAFPQEQAKFYNPRSSHGTMVGEMLHYFIALAADESWLPTMLQTQVLTHHDKGDIALERYRDSLHLLVDVLAEAAGDNWLPAYEAAWRDLADRLYAMIERYY